MNVMFGRWAAKNIINESWDVVHTWSGVSEEVLLALHGSKTAVILLRGSSHIKSQARLLQEEEAGTVISPEIEEEVIKKLAIDKEQIVKEKPVKIKKSRIEKD